MGRDPKKEDRRRTGGRGYLGAAVAAAGHEHSHDGLEAALHRHALPAVQRLAGGHQQLPRLGIAAVRAGRGAQVALGVAHLQAQAVDAFPLICSVHPLRSVRPPAGLGSPICCACLYGRGFGCGLGV